MSQIETTQIFPATGILVIWGTVPMTKRDAMIKRKTNWDSGINLHFAKKMLLPIRFYNIPFF